MTPSYSLIAKGVLNKITPFKSTLKRRFDSHVSTLNILKLLYHPKINVIWWYIVFPNRF